MAAKKAMVHRRPFLKIYSIKFCDVWQNFYFYRILSDENFKMEVDQTNFVTHLIITVELYYWLSKNPSVKIWSNKKLVSNGNSGAPARAKRGWDRAPYPWNMVNLFRLVVTWLTELTNVRTYVRVYRLYGWGRGDYQKEGRGVSGVSWQAHIFNIGH